MRTRFRSASRFVLLVVFALMAFSCKSKKALGDSGINRGLSAKSIIRTHYQNALDFKTISGKMRIDYSDGESTQGVSVNLRMEKDKAIWISAPFGMVKAYITPGRVSFYNKLQNEYFDGDFAYLSRYLGTELDFKQVQNLLLGEALFDLNDGKYEASVVNGSYRLKPKKAMELFKVLFEIEPRNFKMASQQLSQPLNKRLLQINYTGYQKVNKWVLPKEIAVAAIEGDQRNTIDIEYRNIEFDQDLRFPYNIPKGFKEIVLKDDAR
ncbi:DUF4292 domain-containing protein [Pseudozobellia thermophila]|uniref:Deoxyuridine 5'-triphosphate nucleotidohydrolase n=1 Tax=Pseudozobellia thermophila TaxID=192903 RepID=A0A1M6BQW9_9FLAO|nr:DUF4292 domain-containing protein [Pseudozobellia thermophila]SHI51119.1 protein of unknown function [Pseudozobellia thermophila]